ncbi:hypothetical protein NIES2100_73730 [Calothrix sp. NIES-2100]|nr:hypothetical protein NIES2100_73730 [Calothrix sp. NIES-2100]
MKDLERVYDTTLLSSGRIYQIDGILCRFLFDKGSIKHPQYHFEPLPGQRKQSRIILNRQKVHTKCYVTNLHRNITEITPDAVQLTLW